MSEAMRPILASWLRVLTLAMLLALPAAAFTAAPVRPSAAPPGESPALHEQSRLLARANAAVVGVRAEAVEAAPSVETLGKQRQGSGVVIDADGLVLTIGYLILEAEQVDLVLGDARTIPARVVANDLATGFGLLQSLAPLRLQPVPLGDSAALSTDDPLMIASGGEAGDLSLARLVARRPFSGYWEYHIDGALFTTPPRIDHSGAALFNASGELVGIGSLVVADVAGSGGGAAVPGNMFVPIELLKPILGELKARGASSMSHRAWLGLNCVEVDGEVRVVRVNRDSPAEAAGLLPGDQIKRIDGTEVRGLERLYKTLWRDPSTDRDVMLDIQRGSEVRSMRVRTLDRMKTLKQSHGI